MVDTSARMPEWRFTSDRGGGGGGGVEGGGDEGVEGVGLRGVEGVGLMGVRVVQAAMRWPAGFIPARFKITFIKCSHRGVSPWTLGGALSRDGLVSSRGNYFSHKIIKRKNGK